METRYLFSHFALFISALLALQLSFFLPSAYFLPLSLAPSHSYYWGKVIYITIPNHFSVSFYSDGATFHRNCIELRNTKAVYERFVSAVSPGGREAFSNWPFNIWLWLAFNLRGELITVDDFAVSIVFFSYTFLCRLPLVCALSLCINTTCAPLVYNTKARYEYSMCLCVVWQLYRRISDFSVSDIAKNTRTYRERARKNAPTFTYIQEQKNNNPFSNSMLSKFDSIQCIFPYYIHYTLTCSLARSLAYRKHSAHTFPSHSIYSSSFSFIRFYQHIHRILSQQQRRSRSHNKNVLAKPTHQCQCFSVV